MKNDWLSIKEVATMINSNLDQLNCDERTLVDINVNDDDREIILKILRKQSGGEGDGDRIWQLAFLIDIEQSEFSITDKLQEIELQWSRFDYPESWRDFIYYIPTENVNTEKGIYRNFLIFLEKKRKSLIGKSKEDKIFTVQYHSFSDLYESKRSEK